jgi:DNA repair photolyase
MESRVVRSSPDYLVLSDDERARVAPALLNPIENRKSGLSLNHVIGCPLDCAYCVRHLFANFQMKKPHALMSDEDAVALLLGHKFFRRQRTPIQIFNRATDPFLPDVKEHTFRVLRLLAASGLSNHVLVITRFVVTSDDAARLNQFRPLKLTLLVTYSGIDDKRVEPLGWIPASETLRLAFRAADSYRVVLYWRPIILGLNDSDDHIRRAAALSHFAHATVFTGLFYRDAMREHYRDHDLAEPYTQTARRKILPKILEQRLLPAFKAAGGGPLFRKTSCGVAFAHQEADFNGHFGIPEICDICPVEQLRRCAAAFCRPSQEEVERLAREVGTTQHPEIDDRAITFDSLDEEPRYFIQHSLGYQVHDRRQPHHIRRHGRAEIGWGDGKDDEQVDD